MLEMVTLGAFCFELIVMVALGVPVLVPLVERFNEQRHTAGGRPVFVKAVNANSGDGETHIAHGRLKPVLWSPASSFWGRLLNYESDQLYVGDSNPSIVRTPLVIAMAKTDQRCPGKRVPVISNPPSSATTPTTALNTPSPSSSPPASSSGAARGANSSSPPCPSSLRRHSE